MCDNDDASWLCNTCEIKNPFKSVMKIRQNVVDFCSHYQLLNVTKNNIISRIKHSN